MVRTFGNPLENMERLVPEEALREWFGASELPDEKTRDVLECLTHVRNRKPVRCGGVVDHAIAAAYFYRAPEVTEVEGYDELPGGLPRMTLEIVRGFHKKAAMEEHCSSPETIFGACAINLADRWVEGKEGYKWPYRAVIDAWSRHGIHEPPRHWYLLRNTEREMVGSRERGF